MRSGAISLEPAGSREDLLLGDRALGAYELMLILAGCFPVKVASDPVDGNHAFRVIIRRHRPGDGDGRKITQSA